MAGRSRWNDAAYVTALRMPTYSSSPRPLSAKHRRRSERHGFGPARAVVGTKPTFQFPGGSALHPAAWVPVLFHLLRRRRYPSGRKWLGHMKLSTAHFAIRPDLKIGDCEVLKKRIGL